MGRFLYILKIIKILLLAGALAAFFLDFLTLGIPVRHTYSGVDLVFGRSDNSAVPGVDPNLWVILRLACTLSALLVTVATKNAKGIHMLFAVIALVLAVLLQLSVLERPEAGMRMAVGHWVSMAVFFVVGVVDYAYAFWGRRTPKSAPVQINIITRSIQKKNG